MRYSGSQTVSEGITRNWPCVALLSEPILYAGLSYAIEYKRIRKYCLFCYFCRYRNKIKGGTIRGLCIPGPVSVRTVLYCLN